MNNSDYWMHRITHERDVSAKNDELMEQFLTVTKGYFVWRKEPLIEKYHINHPFTYYYIDIRDESWPKGVKFGWYPLGIKTLFKENVLTFYFKFNGKRLEQGKEQLLSDLGFVFHDKTGTYRKAILVPKGENGDGTFFSLNEKEQKGAERLLNRYI